MAGGTMTESFDPTKFSVPFEEPKRKRKTDSPAFNPLAHSVPLNSEPLPWEKDYQPFQGANDLLPSGQTSGVENTIIPMAARITGGALGAAAGLPGGPATALVGGVLGAEGAGQYADIIMDKRRGIVKTPGQRAQDAAANMAVDASTQGLFSGAGNLAQRSLNAIRGSLAAPNAAERIADLEKLGIPLEGAAPIAGSPTTQKIVEGERRLPISSNIWKQAIDKTRQGIGKAADNIASSLGITTDPAAAGAILKQGVSEYEARSLAEAEKLYKSAYGNVNPQQLLSQGFQSAQSSRPVVQSLTQSPQLMKLDDLPVNIAPVKQEAQNIAEEIKRGAIGTPPAWIGRILEKPDVVDFLTARTMRFDLARAGRGLTEEVAGQTRGAAQRLAGTTDQVMEQWATKLDPTGFSAFRKANEFYKSRAATLDLIGEIADSPTGIQAWTTATAGTNKDPTRLIAIKDNLKPEQWNEYVAARIRDMSLETKGGGTTPVKEFSPERFLSSYRDLTDAVKDTMFGKKGAQLRDNMEMLGRVSGYTKESQLMRDPGTASALITAGGIMSAPAVFLTHPVISALSYGSAGGSLYATSRLMTDPEFVKWIAHAAVLKPTNFSGIAAQVTRLSTIVSAKPYLAPNIKDYLDGLDATLDARYTSDRIMGKTTAGRPVIINSKGQLSTELTVSFDDPRTPGNSVIVPSIYGGKEYSAKDAFAIAAKNNFIDPDTGKPMTTVPNAIVEQTAIEQHRQEAKDPGFIAAFNKFQKDRLKRRETQ